MTPEQINLNEDCALADGRKYNPTRLGTMKWLGPEIMGYSQAYAEPPDTCHDWNYAGLKLVELAAARYWDVHISSPVAGDDWLVWVEEGGEVLSHISGRGKTLEEAISRAWLAWKQEENHV